jgi:Tol biopolymer transport system component
MTRAGEQFGTFRIIAPLGTGGMGEVWRAEDLRLGREVALKMLRGDRHEDPELRARFEREARTVATLAHPNICTLFDIGEHEGRHYLVMEHLEGETLADRLARGPLPAADAVAIARQIASAIAAAHERGIVHRDLKPANVVLTRSGAKLLDFGLARLHAASHHLDDALDATATASVALPGTLVGTLPYMAPEQIEGKPADARSDMWAFGAVLFEMITGRRAFAGDSAPAVLAAVLHSPLPRLAAAAPGAPPALARLVDACLQRDPALRWHCARDAVTALDWIDAAAEGGGTRPAPRSPLRAAVWLAAVAVGAAAMFTVGRWLAPRPAAEQMLRFDIEPPAGSRIVDAVVGTELAVSPDGRTIAYVAQGDGPPRLWLWSVTDGRARALDGSEGAASPFWSPDGRSIAYFAGGTLRRSELAGGPATDLCEAPFGSSGSWGRDRILFSQWAAGAEGLYSVPVSGGAPELLPGSAPDGSEGPRAFPFTLPDGKRYLFLKGGYRGPVAAREVCIGRVDDAQHTCLGRADSRFEFVAPDLLLFVRGGTLLAQQLDLDAGALVGSPVAVMSDAWWFSPSGAAEFSASADGRTLVARRDPGPAVLQWHDRTGRLLATLGEPARYFWPRLSPDGTKLAVCVRDPATGGRDVWLFATDTGIATRMTFDEVDTQTPTWLPGGRQVAYGASRGGPPDIFVRNLDDGSERALLRLPGTQRPRDLSPDGGLLAFEDFSPSRRAQFLIWLHRLPGTEEPQPLSSAPASQHSPRFSPDGRLLAFVSEESGRPEVYVVAVGEPGQKLRVSAAGGSLPRWRGDGKELYFLAGDGLLTGVSVAAGRTLATGTPFPLFHAPSAGPIDLETDPTGERFLFSLPVDPRPGAVMTVTIGWQSAMQPSRADRAD